MVAGMGVASSLLIAALSTPIAVSGGGIDEWPGVARACRRSETEPFSASPTSAATYQVRTGDPDFYALEVIESILAPPPAL